MGERHSGDGPFGCRHAHPGDTLSVPGRTGTDPVGPGLEARLGAALRAGGVDAGAERRAVAAFRAARDARALPARTRRRDDWRPAAPSRPRRAPRATLSVALVSLMLGGVAVAAIGSAGSGPGARSAAARSVRPSANAPHRSAAVGTSAGSAGPGAGPGARPHHPAGARDTAAHCRAYERAGDRGGALDSTAWRRLVRSAGGTDRVAAYCAARVTNGTTGNGQTDGKSAKSGKSDGASAAGGGTAKPKPGTEDAKAATGSPKRADRSAKTANGGRESGS
ncbi:hypothetical protein AQI95_08485 [Streptomyces yokosukanensis]|uniref:Uncharacterized protein n=1 Tax=Streptomyces yokosukanensis TaxID=67386 RepID=A0A124HGX6_9ACTN|nr:hypothetical protein [Streptomyces yokosukanensis]KUN08397.1 hypothetical protein AQI95_08485 [Streptomyces yokosukanensis]